MRSDPQQLFIRSRAVISRMDGGETLIVPVRGKAGNLASIYSFKGTGSFVWQLLESPRGLPELAEAVAREYGIGPGQAQKNVDQFIGEMLSVGLVEPYAASVIRGQELITEPQPHAEWQIAGSR